MGYVLGFLFSTFFISFIVFVVARLCFSFVGNQKKRNIIAGVATFGFGALSILRGFAMGSEKSVDAMSEYTLIVLGSYALWGTLFALYGIWRSKPKDKNRIIQESQV